MYNKNFVAVIKSNGKILREDANGIVRIPFGSNYSILLKNLNTVDVVVDVEVDGENVLQGTNLVISPNSDFELLGKLRDLNKSNKFKFIHKTKQISGYRGDRIDDGVVKITYSFVKPPEVKMSLYDPYPIKYGSPTYNSPTYADCKVSDTTCCVQGMSDGITVKGEEFNCNFKTISVGDMESEIYLIVFKLIGKTKNKKKIKKHLYVNTVLICETCGQKSKSSKKYCSNCGTNLR